MEPLALVFLSVAIKTPPLSHAARVEVGRLLWRLQTGESLGLPHSRPMPSIGRRVHELRVRDDQANWRLVYRIDPDFLLVVDLFAKTTPKTPKHVIDRARERLRRFDAGEGPE
jgi:phage-related protein